MQGRRHLMRLPNGNRADLGTKIEDYTLNTVSGKRIAILGFAFKADTDDTRESPAIHICRMLAEERAELAIHDPQALDNAKRDLAGLAGGVEYVTDPYAAAKDAHAIAILTEWKSFASLDYERIFESMRKPAFIFDGRNILDHKKLHAIGFNVFPLGRSPLTHLE